MAGFSGMNVQNERMVEAAVLASRQGKETKKEIEKVWKEKLRRGFFLETEEQEFETRCGPSNRMCQHVSLWRFSSFLVAFFLMIRPHTCMKEQERYLLQ